MNQADDPFVCYCMQVRRSQIRQAIRDGATNPEAIRQSTRAASGCQSCWWDLEALLAEENAAKQRPEEP